MPLALGCPRVAGKPPTAPDAGTKLHVVAPIKSPAIPRPQNPDPQRVHEALTTILGFPITVLASHPIETPQAPYRDLVIFKSSGDSVCRARLPKERCLEAGGDIIPWREQELLGLAVISFEDPAKPMVTAHRIPDQPGELWNRGFTSEGPGASDGRLTDPERSDIELQDLRAGDFDGDGSQEFILLTSSALLIPDGEDGGIEAIARTRLLILREDLSRQLDTDIGQQVYFLGDGGWLNEEHDRTDESVTFDANHSLVIRWCEYSQESADLCPVSVLCSQLNTEIEFAYNPTLDRYVNPTMTELPSSVNWSDPRCSDECDEDEECMDDEEYLPE